MTASNLVTVDATSKLQAVGEKERMRGAAGRKGQRGGRLRRLRLRLLLLLLLLLWAMC